MNKKRRKELLSTNQKRDSKYVLYWMQQSMRVSYNHALLEAINISNQKNLPLLVCFTLTDGYLGANRRHYEFMLQGIKEVSNELNEMGISFVIKKGEPFEALKPLLLDADTIVMDYGYLKPQLKWRREVYDYCKGNLETNLIMIESDLIVPVKEAYEKTAYAAYAIRPHLLKKMNDYFDFNGLKEINNKAKLRIKSDFNFDRFHEELDLLKLDHSVKLNGFFKGGYSEAIKHLNLFFNNQLKEYEKRSDPSLNIQSYMSIYLHFGQISVLDIIERLKEYVFKYETNYANYDMFIEQLVVRRELAYNFVTYEKDYDLYEKMTLPWAYETIDKHKNDKRLIDYNLEELEYSKTHDEYFNAAMTEMRVTGFMANYMRMYWAKKIMEWSSSMKLAYERIVYLNNKYFLDGRDANSYMNIAWCFGRHDRPWKERNIFGTLRYMNADGLKRKFKIDKYVETVLNNYSILE
ncbi:deoxyribodipyrimidine photo-lyase [Haploplasma axanthum]|nr:deoxyribodipyrimidine photo-lyase [Haploplasma axanthum]